MADLQYSLQLLRSLGRDVSGLADALEGGTAGTRWDADDVGHRRVADALEHFAGSWDDNRGKLTASLRDVGGMAISSAQTFQDVDDHLAAAIEAALEDAR